MDKAALLNEIANSFPDNQTGEISAQDIRTSLSNIVTHNLNLDEAAAQAVTGVIELGVQLELNRLMSAPTHKEGVLFYDSDKKAMSYYNENADVTVNLGQELLIRIYNNSGATIQNGYAVRPTGSFGGLPTVALAKADLIDTATVSGLATADIPNGAIGYVAYIGQVGGINTSSWSSGDFLYLSDTDAGLLINTEPKISSPVAIVLESGANGSVLVGQREVKDPDAVGQAGNASPATQQVTSTPMPLAVYDDNVKLEQNMAITHTVVGSYNRASLSPLSAVYGGRYSLSVSISLESSANCIIVAEIYINGIGTGVRSIIDLSTNNTDIATLTIPSVITNADVLVGDIVEVYIYTNSGTTTITTDNVIFNMQKVGV